MYAVLFETHVALLVLLVEGNAILDVTEAGCMGVAMLAKAFVTGENIRKIAAGWVKPIAKIEPKLKDHYDKKFNTYKKLYPTLRPLLIKNL